MYVTGPTPTHGVVDRAPGADGQDACGRRRLARGDRAQPATACGPAVVYHQADLFAWEPPQQYDVVFFSFWLAHVPPERFAAFWELVGRALRPEGRVVLLDSYQALPAEGADGSLLSHRELKDGRAFTIVKVFYQPEPLRQQLASHGWDVAVGRTAEHVLHGVGRRARAD